MKKRVKQKRKGHGIDALLEGVLKKHQKGAIVMMELPVEAYCEANLTSVRFLTAKGFEGVYVSFHRPFRSIIALLEQARVNTRKLLFVDLATVLVGEGQEKSPQCVHIGQDIDIDELVRVIYTGLERLKGKKKFVFVDSLTTITLYKPLSETMRFSEFLMRTVQKQGGADVILILNVAKDLAQKKFIRDIALRVDEVVNVGR